MVEHDQWRRNGDIGSKALLFSHALAVTYTCSGSLSHIPINGSQNKSILIYVCAHMSNGSEFGRYRALELYTGTTTATEQRTYSRKRLNNAVFVWVAYSQHGQHYCTYKF